MIQDFAYAVFRAREIYTNSNAIQHEPGPEPDTIWEKGVTQLFNPEPAKIQEVVDRWLPVFGYVTERAISAFLMHTHRDLNGDLKIGLADLTILAKAYGSGPGYSNWNPNADVNGNGVVDLSDLVIMANHYGQHYP